MERKKGALENLPFFPHSNYFQISEFIPSCVLDLAQPKMHPVTQILGTFATRLVRPVTQHESIFRRITSPPIQALSL